MQINEKYIYYILSINRKFVFTFHIPFLALGALYASAYMFVCKKLPFVPFKASFKWRILSYKKGKCGGKSLAAAINLRQLSARKIVKRKNTKSKLL